MYVCYIYIYYIPTHICCCVLPIAVVVDWYQSVYALRYGMVRHGTVQYVQYVQYEQYVQIVRHVQFVQNVQNMQYVLNNM